MNKSLLTESKNHLQGSHQKSRRNINAVEN